MNQVSIAQRLLNIGAVSFALNPPFTLSSGLHSPIYCDNRMNISYVENRKAIIDAFVELIKKEFADVDVIAGVSTGAIAWGAWIADELNLPMVYIRGKAKAHGKGKRVEGMIKKGQKVVVVEDLFSTGKGALEAVSAIREDTQADLMGVVAIASYDLQVMKDNFKNNNVSYFSLESFENLLKTAVEDEYISEEDSKHVIRWQNDPQNWSL